MEDKIKDIIKKLKESKYCVAFTGAGISTESGIPDFRGRNGIYNYISEDVFSIEIFYKQPEIFYKFAREWLGEIITKTPNRAHIVLAKLEKYGILKSIITQNIDGLHQKAGAKIVYEIHGNIRTAHCLKCGRKFEFQYIQVELVDKNNIPVRCKFCGGIIKPDVVFFGESLPEDLSKAIEEARNADLMLILGTSLTVYPAAMLPEYCSGELIIINKDSTPLDSRASVVLHKPLGECFELIEKFFNLY